MTMPDPAPTLGASTLLAGVVLAGGRASRFGADKMLADLDGQPLIGHAIARLRPGVAELAISASGDPARFAAFGLPVLPDAVPGFQGPLAGILAGLDWAAARGYAAIVTVAGDTPFFPPDLVICLRVAAVTEGAPVALACAPGPGGGIDAHPTFGLWSVALRGDLAAALAAGERRVRAFAEARGAAPAIFEGRGPGAFLNVNTREDLDRARGLAPAERGSA